MINKKNIKKKTTKQKVEKHKKKIIKFLSDSEIEIEVLKIHKEKNILQKEKAKKVLKEKTPYSIQVINNLLKEHKEKDKLREKKLKEKEKQEEIKNIEIKPIPQQILNKYAVLIVSKDAIYLEDNIAKVNSKKIINYIERKYVGDEVLWIPPNDCFRAEFEDDFEVNKKFIAEMEINAKSLGFDYCITGHGGTSDYFNMFNIKEIPLTEDNQNAKLLLADLLMPKKAKDQLDRTNLGRTLSPIIGHPHWKPKYNGAIHKIIRGKNPLEHENEYPKELLKQLKKSKKDNKTYLINVKQTNEWVEDFLLKYCCENLLPKGARHFIIEKNLAAFIIHRKDKEEIKKRYYIAQERKHDSLRTWETAILKGDYGNVSAGELHNFITEYDISYKNKKENKPIDIFTTKIQAIEYGKVQPYFYDEGKLFWLWNKENFCWEQKDDISILNMIEDTTQKDIITAKNRQEILNALKGQGRRNIPKEMKPSWVQFKDIIIDIETGEEFKPVPEFFITNPIPWKLGESEETPTIDRLFEKWVKKEDIPRLLEIPAFVMVPKYFIHSFFFLYAPPGYGKTAFENFLIKFIGKDNYTSTSIDRINTNIRFETKNWYRKLLITMDEVNDIYQLKNSSVINGATGESPVPAEFKGSNKDFKFINYGKFVYPTNQLLKVDSEDGFGRRVRKIDFITRFEKEKDVITEIPDWEFENLAKKCLRIAKQLWKKRQFTGDVIISKRIKDYQEASKTNVERFIDNFCDITDSETYIPFDNFFSKFSTQLRKDNKEIPTKNKIGKKLRDMGWEVRVKNYKDTQTNLSTESYVWNQKLSILGIKFKEGT